MIFERILALVALAMLAAFCAVLVTFVQRLDLTIVVVIGILLAAYDLLIFSFGGPRNGKSR